MRSGWGRGECDFCGTSLEKWDYHHAGKRYCRRCYDRAFRLRTCSACGKRKMIHKDLSDPVCKICRIKDKPCIRCGREILRNGKITEAGPVCASCAGYFRPEERCPVCGETSRRVFLFSIDGTKRKMCEKCRNKRLPLCSKCSRRKPCRTGPDGEPVCAACSSGTRKCLGCGKVIPKGRGRICGDCASRNALGKKVRFATGGLPPRTAEVFGLFARWFEEKRGPQVASMRVLEYLPLFLAFGRMEEESGSFPGYGEMARSLGTKRLWENRLAVEFMDAVGIVERDRRIQEEISERDMIARHLAAFSPEDPLSRPLRGYHERLIRKREEGRTSLRSVRLALTPARKFLEYCSHCRKKVPDREALEGYLWLYPGQKSALTGFANFLDQKYATDLDITTVAKPVLERTEKSEEYLRQRLISVMRDPEKRKLLGADGLLKLTIACFHRIEVPDNVLVDFAIKGQKPKIIKCAGNEIALPKEIVELIF